MFLPQSYRLTFLLFLPFCFFCVFAAFTFFVSISSYHSGSIKIPYISINRLVMYLLFLVSFFLCSFFFCFQQVNDITEAKNCVCDTRTFKEIITLRIAIFFQSDFLKFIYLICTEGPHMEHTSFTITD